MLKVTFTLDQPIYDETTNIIRDILIDSELGTYNSFDIKTLRVEEVVKEEQSFTIPEVCICKCEERYENDSVLQKRKIQHTVAGIPYDVCTFCFKAIMKKNG